MDSDVVDLRAQSQTLRRRWRLIALMSVLGLAAALALAYLQTPTYTATAEVLVDPLSAQAPTTGVVVPLEEISNNLLGGKGAGLTFVLYGAIITLIARFQPGGLLGLLERGWRGPAPGDAADAA